MLKALPTWTVLAKFVAVSIATLFPSVPGAGAGQPAAEAASPTVGAAAEKTSRAAENAPLQLAVNQEGPTAAPAAGLALNRGEPASVAERIGVLQRSVEEADKRLKELKASLENPESEFVKAEQAFTQLDQELTRAGKREASAPKGEPAAAANAADLDELRKKRELAKERFDLAIQERKATQESIRTLEEKLLKERQQLETMLGDGTQTIDMPKLATSPPAEAAARPEAEEPASPASPVPAPAIPAPLMPATSEPAAAGSPVLPVDAAPARPGLSPPEPTAPAAAPPAAPPAVAKVVNKEIEAAAATAQRRTLEAQAAEEKAQAVSEHVEILRKNIDSERSLRDTARKQAENAERTLRGLNQEADKKIRASEYPHQLRVQAGETELRLRQAQAESQRAAARIDELQTELGNLQAEHLRVQRDVTQKRSEAEKAQARVESLRNPFAPRNVAQWFLDHGPPLLAIGLAMALVLWLSRVLENRLIRLLARRGRRGTAEERENRARTLLGVFRNVVTLLIVSGGSMMVLEEVGIPVGPLLGGAAVLGLAVAFGAQSLIKDYFTGFMVILEQQYMINDVIKIGDVDGQVEKITLRMTVLRDLEGRVHFVPHGQIATVTNLTHNWSRALFDIPVAYKEDVDRVIEILADLGRGLQRDPNFTHLILEPPSMLGVDAFDDSAVIIKFFIKTKPLKQWLVKRELLRRIKHKFDELGIEIPYPHRTVYHHHSAECAEAGRGVAGDRRSREAA